MPTTSMFRAWHIIPSFPRGVGEHKTWTQDTHRIPTKNESPSKNLIVRIVSYVREKGAEEAPHPVPQARVEVVEDDLRLVGRNLTVVVHVSARHDVRHLEKRGGPVR